MIVNDNNDLLYVQQEYDKLARVVKEARNHLDAYIEKFDVLEPLDNDLLAALNLLGETPLWVADELNEAERVADLEAAVAVSYLEKFTKAHGLELEQKGEVGFGRPCVGLISEAGNYLDYNPWILNGLDFAEVFEHDGRLQAPRGVNRYHKHPCFAVLVEDEDYDEALIQLRDWIRHIVDQGDVITVSYATGATGLQALLSGVIGWALRFTDTLDG